MSDRRGIIMLIYDIPSITSNEKRGYRLFRKQLISSGYVMMQESVYVKLMHNVSAAEQELKTIKGAAPKDSNVSALTMSLAEFRSLKTLSGAAFDMAAFSDDIVWIDS